MPLEKQMAAIRQELEALQPSIAAQPSAALARLNEIRSRQQATESKLAALPQHKRQFDTQRETAKDIIFGQLRLVVATMDIEEINSDRDKFLINVSSNVGNDAKIGLMLINQVTDIRMSGYIEAEEAAAKPSTMP
jgi:hypothetical protein